MPGSGKSTVFRALTGVIEPLERKGQDPKLGVVKVSDSRLDFLTAYHKPKKVTPVHVEYTDIAGITGEGKPGRSLGDKVLGYIRPMDALIHCVRFFDAGAGAPQPLKDFHTVEEEMILSDMSVIEKRLERVSRDFQKGRKDLAEELELLKTAYALLEEGKPLRLFPPASESEKLKGFAFLSAKPQMVLINVGEEADAESIRKLIDEFEKITSAQPDITVDWLYADSEAEIARLSPEEAEEFLKDLHLDEGAKKRIIRKSFDLLNLIVFLTAGEPEVRAWPLKKGKTALKAAGTIHSDMERGFIRAEVVAFEDFKSCGSMTAAQKQGKFRLEGRDYVVQDGDIFLFRFNV